MERGCDTVVYVIHILPSWRIQNHGGRLR